MNKKTFQFITLLTIIFLILSYGIDRSKGDFIKIENGTSEYISNIYIESNQVKTEAKPINLEPGTYVEFKLDIKSKPKKININLVYNDNKSQELLKSFTYRKNLKKKFIITGINKDHSLIIKENNFGLINNK